MMMLSFFIVNFMFSFIVFVPVIHWSICPLVPAQTISMSSTCLVQCSIMSVFQNPVLTNIWMKPIVFSTAKVGNHFEVKLIKELAWHKELRCLGSSP
jgi:uncharacterized membrane protein